MNELREARILIHRYTPTGGEEKLHYMWDGPIDGRIRVDIALMDQEFYMKIPFKLMRLRNFDGRTAVFIRIDWKARLVRLFRRLGVLHE